MKKFWILLPVLFLVACYGVVPQDPVPTPTLTIVPSPSATIEWFPPSHTPEPFSTIMVSPTQEIRSEIGEVIFTDDFDSPEDWNGPQSTRGQINVSGGEINIIINEPKALMLGTLEKPDLADFYAEITANPVLCSGRDEYGFLFRTFGWDQYYRLAVTCDGIVRMDKLVSGELVLLYPPTRSGSVPVGAPSISKLEILTMRDEIRVFINGDPQFTVFDQDLQVGSFGVYARSAGENAVTVSFSELIVREVVPK